MVNDHGQTDPDAEFDLRCSATRWLPGCSRQGRPRALRCSWRGVGNLVGRIRYGGVVVDFMNIGIGPLRTGIFNVADLAIFAGALVLIAGRLGERARWM